MFRRLTMAATLGALIFTASCAETKTDEAPPEEAAPVAAPVEEGPYYELTKDEVTSHPDWTSKNITFMGAKVGDNKVAVDKIFGKTGVKTDPVGPNHYRTIFDKSNFAIYTFKMTGELQKIEIYSHMASQIADPKFKKLLTSGDLKYMRDNFGMEDSAETNFDTGAMEYIYGSRGFRFVQYNTPGQKVNALLFEKVAKPEDKPAEEKATEEKK